MDATASCIVHDELAYADPGFTLGYLAHALLFVNNFYWAATAAQRKRYLPKVLSGETIGAMGMTEPAVGTDVLGMQTTARKRRRPLRPQRPQDVHHQRPRGRRAAGLRQGRRPDHDVRRRARLPRLLDQPEDPEDGHARVDDVRADLRGLPRPGRATSLGSEGGGITNMMRNLEIERLGLAAMSLGIARRCLDVMVRYATERHSFGKPLHEHGQIQRYIGESYAKVEAMRALVYNVAATVGPTQRNRLGTDAAKLFAATAAKEVADAAIQVLGGYGYCSEYRVEQFLRDAKLIEIGGGTLEAHQKNIMRDLTRR